MCEALRSIFNRKKKEEETNTSITIFVFELKQESPFLKDFPIYYDILFSYGSRESRRLVSMFLK